MTTPLFEQSCDYLIQQLDPQGFKAKLWAKNEGATLDIVKAIIERLFEEENGIIIEETESANNWTVSYLLISKEIAFAKINARVQGDRLNVFVSETDCDAVEIPDRFMPETMPVTEVTDDTLAEAVARALRQISVLRKLG